MLSWHLLSGILWTVEVSPDYPSLRFESFAYRHFERGILLHMQGLKKFIVYRSWFVDNRKRMLVLREKFSRRYKAWNIEHPELYK